MKRRRASVSSSLPRPFDGEGKIDYRERFIKHPIVTQAYPGMGRRLVAAERTWQQAKAQSLVSITTAFDQFLLFGSLES